MTAPPPTAPLPTGFRVRLDPGTKQLADDLWFGGSPPRVLRLTAGGRRVWDDLLAHGVDSEQSGRLARRFTDAGLAHPVPPAGAEPVDVTVVVPVHDRPRELDRCLAALGSRYRVLVVDDASSDAAAMADVAQRHGATLVRRDVNGGPGAARDSALEHVGTDVVAFLDSDCEPVPDWIAALLGHLADPLVAAVAPRVIARADGSWSGRYTSLRGSLDLGPAAARVAPNTRLSYVPTAALLTRSAALRDVARNGAVFDPDLRVGEDVDLVWRLHEAGWRVRYEPSVDVGHHEPSGWVALLRRRFRYGTSAAPLALRHPHAMAPIVTQPWPALCVTALLARRPLAAAAAFAAAVATLGTTLRRAQVPTHGLLRAMAEAVWQTWLGTGRYATQLGGIPLLAGAARSPKWRRGAVSLLLGPALAAWWPNRRELDPPRFAAGVVADEIAYGLGVWAGCAAHHTTIPLRPRITRPALTPKTVDPSVRPTKNARS